ncbi:MAG: hypothetical protein KGZ61_07320 [Sandarakinorhabdus sp.]|nr:hypothetical protein [Sandarakinorhabdus sp.]
MPDPETFDLIAISGLGRDYSLKEERTAEALAWLELVSAEVETLPGGSRFASLMGTLRDEQRRADLRRLISPAAIRQAEALLEELLRKDWEARFGSPPKQSAA